MPELGPRLTLLPIRPRRLFSLGGPVDGRAAPLASAEPLRTSGAAAVDLVRADGPTRGEVGVGRLDDRPSAPGGCGKAGRLTMGRTSLTTGFGLGGADKGTCSSGVDADVDMAVDPGRVVVSMVIGPAIFDAAVARGETDGVRLDESGPSDMMPAGLDSRADRGPSLLRDLEMGSGGRATVGGPRRAGVTVELRWWLLWLLLLLLWLLLSLSLSLLSSSRGRTAIERGRESRSTPRTSRVGSGREGAGVKDHGAT